MRASEFIFNEGKASRRKQASMNAKRRMANAQQTTAPAAQPTASTGTSAPASVATRPNPFMTPQANMPSEPEQEVQPTQPPSPGTDWNALNQATAPAPAPAPETPSRMNALAQKAYSTGQTASNAVAQKISNVSQNVGQSIASAPKKFLNRFTTKGKIANATDRIFIDKFLKDMNTAEQKSTGLRGEPFDIKTWVGKYLAQNSWDTGEQQTALDSAIASNNKKAIATAMAAIGKYNNLGSTIKAKAANSVSTGAMGQMAKTLSNPAGSGTSSTVYAAKPNNPNQQYATQPTASPTTTAPQQTSVATTQPATQSTTKPAANPFGQMATQLTKPAAPTKAAQSKPQATTEPIKIGGQTLDPNDPADAKMIAMLKKQGKI
jgi:hypothetical protein